MSWQTFIDEQLMKEIEGHSLKAAAILGHDGAVWAQSSDFPQFEPDQISAIMDEFNNPDSHARTGLHLGEDKYMLILGEPGSVIRGKKGASGITVKKTTETLIFGIYESPMTQEKCNMVVEKLGDYLVEEGH